MANPLDDTRQLIASGDIQAALDRLRAYAADHAPRYQDEVLLDSARYQRLRRDARQNVITHAEAEAAENKLSVDLLQLVGVLTRESAFGPASTAETALPQHVGLEITLGANNFRPVGWLRRGVDLTRCVCRILTPVGMGTGFLIAPDRLMTNHHILPSADVVQGSQAEFNYETDAEGTTCRYALDAGCYCADPVLDYAIVGVIAAAQKPPLATWGQAPLNPHAEPLPGESVMIIQHPNGGPKQVVLSENRVVSTWEYRVHYTADTLPGSSGAPVFNDLWQVIAIHHRGGEALQVNAAGDQARVNEGILMAPIKAHAGAFWPAG